MLHVRFSKATASKYLDAILYQDSIEHDDAEWTRDELLMLAGVCFFLALFRAKEGPDLLEQVHLERGEALAETAFADAHTAIEFLGDMARRVEVQEYDASFAPVIEFDADGDGKTIRPVSGFTGPEWNPPPPQHT